MGGLKREGADEAPTPVILNDTPVTASNDGPGEQAPEPVGSPDWPDEPAEDEGPPSPPASFFGRERVPSRSPGISPEPGILDTEEEGKRVEAWKDPLDENDVEEEEAPATKRPRISG